MVEIKKGLPDLNNQNNEREKVETQKLIDKITNQATNMFINGMFYDIKKLEKKQNQLWVKVFAGNITEEEKVELEAINKVLHHHEKGGRISDLKF